MIRGIRNHKKLSKKRRPLILSGSAKLEKHLVSVWNKISGCKRRKKWSWI